MRHSISFLTILASATSTLEGVWVPNSLAPARRSSSFQNGTFKVQEFEFENTQKGLFEEGVLTLHFTLKKKPCAPLVLSWKQGVGTWTINATLLGTTISIRQFDLSSTIQETLLDLLHSCKNRDWTVAPQ